MPRALLASKQPEEQRRHSAAKGSVPTPVITRGRSSEDRPKCDLCPNQFDWPFKCEKFRSLQLSDRKAYVVRHEMCFNCFSRKHEAGQCPDRVCPRCNTHHNSLLCSANKNPIKKSTFKPEQVVWLPRLLNSNYSSTTGAVTSVRQQYQRLVKPATAKLRKKMEQNISQIT